jgi:CheY-like chemotaxis protein
VEVRETATDQYQSLMDAGSYAGASFANEMQQASTWDKTPTRTTPSLRSRVRAGVGRRHEGLVMALRSLVSVVDDDESVRDSLPDLLWQLGFACQAFSSAGAFLASEVVGESRCLILDVAMPGMSGPDLQQELANRDLNIPIVFITAHDDMSVRPRLLARGAVECLFKPFSEAALLDALNTALGRKEA